MSSAYRGWIGVDRASDTAHLGLLTVMRFYREFYREVILGSKVLHFLSRMCAAFFRDGRSRTLALFYRIGIILLSMSLASDQNGHWSAHEQRGGHSRILTGLTRNQRLTFSNFLTEAIRVWTRKKFIFSNLLSVHARPLLPRMECLAQRPFILGAP